MLEFPDDFFQAEVREDFLIDETMKTVWAASMEVLQEIDIICERHHLTWYAGYGTLLGTVRHKGFVPWDDDIDILMLRKDYMKLLQVLQEELPEGYIVKCALLDKEFSEYHCLVQNSDEISVAPGRLRKFHNCPFIVGVDIYPLDYVPHDPTEKEYVRNSFLLARQLIWKLLNEEDGDGAFEKGIKALEQQFKVILERPVNEQAKEKLVIQLWKIANQMAMRCKERDGSFLTMYGGFVKSEAVVYEKEWFQNVEYLPFEQVLMPVPKGYDKLLRVMYGDYSVRQKREPSEDYPHYKKQLELVREAYQKLFNT